MNKVILIGVLAKDIKFKKQNGVSLADVVISICDEIGNSKKTTLINCKFVGEYAEIAHEYLGRGNYVLIEGELNTNEYRARTGEKRLWVEVLVLKLTLLSYPSIKPSKIENIKELYLQSKQALNDDE